MHQFKPPPEWLEGDCMEMEVFSRVEGGENVLERRVRVVKVEVGREGRRKRLERENMRCERVDSDQQHIRLHRGAEGELGG